MIKVRKINSVFETQIQIITKVDYDMTYVK